MLQMLTSSPTSWLCSMMQKCKWGFGLDEVFTAHGPFILIVIKSVHHSVMARDDMSDYDMVLRSWNNASMLLLTVMSILLYNPASRAATKMMWCD